MYQTDWDEENVFAKICVLEQFNAEAQALGNSVPLSVSSRLLKRMFFIIIMLCKMS